MRDGELFTVAGTNLHPFVEAWIAEIEAADPEQFPALGAVRNPHSRNRSLMGAAYVIQQIAPRCWGAGGSREELLLLAVIGSNDRWGEVSDDAPWPGIEEYVRRAFVGFHQLGEREVARRLREGVFRGSIAEDRRQAAEFRRSIGVRDEDDPAKEAAHEQTMAAGSQRDLRVADALDPGGDPWASLLGGSIS